MPDIKQIFNFLETDQGHLEGKNCNPWADPSFNYCTLEPDAEDVEEKVGLEGVTTIERFETIIDQAGSCYWKKIGSDIYYAEGDVLMGTSISPGEARVTIQKPGTLGFNLDLLELINSANGTNIIGTAASIAWYLNHSDTTEKSSRIMARVMAGIESNWASTAWVLFQEFDRFGIQGSGDSNFNAPCGICTDGTYLYICDTNNDRIVKRSLWDYSVIKILGTAGSGTGNFQDPKGICTDGVYIYVADSGNHRIKIHLCSDLSYYAQFGTSGSGDTNFNGPWGITLIGSTLYIVDSLNHRVKKHSKDGTYIGQYGSFGAGDNNLSAPKGICTDGTYIYICDNGNTRIMKRLASDLTNVAHVHHASGAIGICYEPPYLYMVNGGLLINKYETSMAWVESSGSLGASCNDIICEGRYFYVTDYLDENGLANSGIGILIAPDGIVTANVFNSYLGFATSYNGINQQWVRITSQGYVGINTLNPDARLDVHGNLKVDGNSYVSTKSFIGAENANADQTIGLTINAGVNEDQVLAFKGTGNVDHGMSALVETDTFGDFRVNTANGGTELNGYTAGTIGVALYGFYTTGNTVLTTAGFGAVTMYAAKKSGTTYGPCAATDNVFCVRPYITGPAWSSVFLINAGGNAWLPGKVQANQLQSNVTVGTAPLVITSTTLCANLNADLWDGYQFAEYLDQAVKQASGPTFAHLHISDLASVITPAESWIGPTNATGIYFKGGLIGIGKTDPSYTLDIQGQVHSSGGALTIDYDTAGFPPAQFLLRGGSDTNQQLLIGYNTTYNYGSIQVIKQGAGYYPLCLQPVAGTVCIGTISPATSALLDLTSTTGALLLPRMTTTQRDALTAVNGMLIYNATLNKFQGYENGAWADLI